jgi:hypothetical protein
MPIDFNLTILSGDPWPVLRRCPSIARHSSKESPLDVTELALVEDIYGHSHLLGPDDAAFLASEGSDDVLMPRDVAGPSGLPQTGFAGVLRSSFIGWLAKVGRETGASLLLCYSHERGDYLYELARWWFGPQEELHLISFDGCDEPQWQGQVQRRRG